MAAHIMLLRWRGGASPSRALLGCFSIAVAAALANVTFVIATESGALPLAVVYALLTIMCLFILYGPFFYTIHTSISVQSLLLLMNRPEGVPIRDLLERFASRRLFEGRLTTMVASRYLVHERGYFRLTAKGRRVSGVFRELKAAWRLGAGG